ncbi:MAG: TRAP transporter substrate-binding protein DctP, partial [Proteobacteria bacterium]|nr:TRAP transporter substrate-binding protein DctP [Pseudomonadota bacterium]
DDICQSSAIMKALMEQIPAFSMEAENNQIRPLFFHLLNPYLLVTKEPVLSVFDLKGKRIRTWGKDMPRLIEAVNGRPVPLFLPDIYPALERNVIDGCPFSVDLVVSYKIYELAKHITEVVLWEGPGWGVWISEKAWEKLTPRHRQIFMETAEKARLLEISATQAAEKNARAFLKQNKVTFHAFPEQELAKWQRANPDFFKELILTLSKKGQADAARNMVALWLKMRKDIKCPPSD